MPPFPGFVGPSYQLADRMATVERSVNWHLVANEAAGEESKFKLAFDPSPGNQAFGELPVPATFNNPCRGLLENRGVAYGVNGEVVFSIDSAGAYTNIGVVGNDAKPVSMVANGNGQIFIASAGSGYVIPAGGGAGSLVTAGAGFLGASYATFQDGYIIVVTPNSNQYQISGDDDTPLGDARIWSVANVSIQAGQADLLVAVLSSREYLRLFGKRRSQIHYNIGSGGIGQFPFQSYNETFIETGCAAPFSIANLSDSLVWIGEDARGQRACWRDAAFQPSRVSTFAVEQIWQSYARVDNAVAFPYIWNGHLIYRVTFPTATMLQIPVGTFPTWSDSTWVLDPTESAALGRPTAFLSSPATEHAFPLGGDPTFQSATWEYDVTTSTLLGRPVWYERTYQTSLGYSLGRPELFHCYCYGKHLVGSGGGDGNPGAIYQMANVGTRDQDPQLLLRWSNDGGNTFGTEQNIPLGLIGQYSKRVHWDRCGYSRDRVFWLRYAGETECGTAIDGSQSQQAIVRDRICPHVYNSNKRVVYNRIEFEVSRGVGSSDGTTPSTFTTGIVNAELDLTPLGS